jgi:hypothetical protein
MSSSHGKNGPVDLDPPLASRIEGLIADPDRVVLRKRTILVVLAAVVGSSLALAPVTDSAAAEDTGSETGVQAAVGAVKPLTLNTDLRESSPVPVVVAVSQSFDQRAQVISAVTEPVDTEPDRVQAADSGEVEAVSASSVWDRLADCESGDWDSSGWPIEGSARWDYGISYSHGDIYEGGLNFHPSTWDAYRDAGMPAHAGEATRSQQIRVAERVLDAQGWGAWPSCSSKLGLR